VSQAAVDSQPITLNLFGRMLQLLDILVKSQAPLRLPSQVSQAAEVILISLALDLVTLLFLEVTY
jgi:hypothetical protein